MTEPRTMAEETLATIARETERLREAIAYFQSGSITEAAQDAVRHYAHAAACIRFVAAIDRAEIRVLGKYEQRDIIGVIKTISANEDIVYSAPTALEAFAKATADTTEGR